MFTFFSSRFIEDFFQKPGVTLTEEQKRTYNEDLYMDNLPEKEVYISQLKAAGFTDIQVCKFIKPSCFPCCPLFVNETFLKPKNLTTQETDSI